MSVARNVDVSSVARQQLKLFLSAAEMAGLDPERQGPTFRLSPDDWQKWLGILDDAPLPSRPAVPLMLRHLGYVTNRLERAARLEHVYA